MNESTQSLHEVLTGQQEIIQKLLIQISNIDADEDFSQIIMNLASASKDLNSKILKNITGNGNFNTTEPEL